MSEEQDQKQSRRAQRREAQAGAEPDAAPDENEASSDPPTEEGAAEPAEGTPGEVVREENRQARRAAAARRRTNKRDRERDRARDIGLDAGEMVDDAVARGTDSALKWVQKHFNIVQWAIVLGIAGWIGWEIYSWRQNKAEARSSDALITAVRAEGGKIGAPEDEGKPDIRGDVDERRVFASAEARNAEAEKAYRAAEGVRPGAPIERMAELGLAGVLYDQGKYADASKIYEAVYASELAKKDPDARGRALEGIGLCLEGTSKPDEALKRYKELESLDIAGFTPLARFSQARILHAQGKSPEAKALLVKVVEATKPAEPGEPPGYVGQSARDLLEAIDPGASATGDIAKDAVEQALDQIKKAVPAATAPSKAP